MFRVLFLAARPDSAHADLRSVLPRFVEDLERGLRFTCRVELDTSLEGLSQVIASFRPHIVHVLSHRGTTHLTVDGSPVWAAALFSRTYGIVRCLVLDGCFDTHQAQAITRSVDCVLGMSAQVDLDVRQERAARFYETLAKGQSLNTAVALAVQQFQVEGPWGLTPVVLWGAQGVLAELRLAEQSVPEPPPKPVPIASQPVYESESAEVYSLPQSAAWDNTVTSAPTGRSTGSWSVVAGDQAVAVASPAPAPPTMVPGLRLDNGPDAEPIYQTARDDKLERHLNAGFFRGATLVPPSEALAVEQGPYLLGVNVGRFWSPGKIGSSIPESALAHVFKYFGRVALDVMVRSTEVAVLPAVQQLKITAVGDTEKVYFQLTFPGPGRYSLSVDLLFYGHLLQSRHIECQVVAGQAAAGDKPQDSHITFTRTAELSPKALEQLKSSPRQLTILAERDANTNSIGLCIYDRTHAAMERRETRLTDTSLVKVLKVLREKLAATMSAYQGGIGGNLADLTQHLGILADLGRRFHRALFPEANVTLAPGSIIQVAPLSAQLSVPWELLYQHPIESYRKDSIRLCSTFKSHPPADCPSQGDAQVVCPHGFWGYRYIVEQLPCRSSRNEQGRAALPLVIENQKPLELCAVVNTKLRLVGRHLAALRALKQMNVVQVDTLEGLKKQLVKAFSQTDLLYFYTHGGIDEFGSPYLEIGSDVRIEPNDFDAWGLRFHPHRPLIFMNACESASYSPDQFDDLIQLLCSRGAAGVIGTQCEVRELLAHEFVLLFLHSFFRNLPAGRALFEARHALLAQHDPRGLAYSLFAAAEIRLEHPLL